MVSVGNSLIIILFSISGKKPDASNTNGLSNLCKTCIIQSPESASISNPGPNITASAHIVSSNISFVFSEVKVPVLCS